MPSGFAFTMSRLLEYSNKEETMDRRFSITGFMALVVLLVSGCAEMPSIGGSDALMKMLTSKLGVTETQAKGGVGSELTLAKEKLPSADVNALAKTIPGSDTYMKAAKDLGAVNGLVGDKAGLESAFQRLGMKSGMVDKFSGLLSDFVGKMGGEPVKNALAAVLK
jgi:Protein of unknown function VcgC/VcgE (DUF2780)